MSRKLTLDDIADLRAYEREREDFRAEVIALKKRRRVGVGPFMTFVFENRDTIRFQIQEMARVEKLITDEAIETELRTYNPLVPEPGELAATLFIELTSELALRDWLPRLVGIEQSRRAARRRRRRRRSWCAPRPRRPTRRSSPATRSPRRSTTSTSRSTPTRSSRSRPAGRAGDRPRAVPRTPRRSAPRRSPSCWPTCRRDPVGSRFLRGRRD